MRTVLIISYWYAPSPAVGGKRFSFLARELDSMGYDVHVITHEARDWTAWKSDASLPLAGSVHRCREDLQLPLPGKGLLARVANAFLRRALAPVGWEIFWVRSARRKALEVARGLAGGEAGVVIATSPTPAALMTGAQVARALDWPLIVDYRDPWSAHAWPRWRRGALAQWLARRLERRVLRRSAARVLNTAAMRAEFQKFFPGLPADRNHVIPNGFDPASASATPSTDGPVTVLHAGEIFTGRSLVPVLQAAARLESRRPGRPIRLVTYGSLPQPELARIREAGLERFIEVRERIPFAALFAELQRAHLLVAVVGEHMAYSTPYKVYDYMASGRPILGLAPRGAALFELLADSGAGSCYEPEDLAGIEGALERALDGDAPARTRVERFRWTHLAQQYRGVIEQVAAPAPAERAPGDAAPRGSTPEPLDV